MSQTFVRRSSRGPASRWRAALVALIVLVTTATSSRIAVAQRRVGSFVSGERAMYLETAPFVDGQSIHLELRNVPAGATGPLLIFSTDTSLLDLTAMGIPGNLGPDLTQGGVVDMDPVAFTYDDTLPSGIAGATIYLQVYVGLPTGGGRLSSMTTVHVDAQGTDPGNAPTITFPLTLTTQQVLPTGVDGVDFAAQPMRVGLPLPKGQVFETNGVPQLAVTGGTSAAQFSTLAHWSDGSVRWALCEWLADLAKDTTSTQYSVDHGSGNVGGADVASVSGDVTTIDTGVLRVQFKLWSANLFDSFQLNGREVFDTTRGNSLHFFDENGVEWTWQPLVCTVRRNGPVRAEVEVGGAFTRTSSEDDPDRVYVAIYFEACKGSPSLRATATLRNTSVNYPQSVAWRGFTWRAWLAGSGPFSVNLSQTRQEGVAPGAVWSGSLAAPTDDASYFQGFARTKKIEITNDPNGALYVPFVERYDVDDFAIEGVRARIGTNYFTGTSATGWWSANTDFADPTFLETTASDGTGVMVGIEHANLTWPCELACGGDGRVEIGLFPVKDPSDSYDYSMPWATIETRSFWITAEDAPTSDAYSAAAPFDYPLTAWGDPWVYNQADVWHWKLVTRQNVLDYCSLSGMRKPAPAPCDLIRTIFEYADETGAQNNQWQETQRFCQALRSGDGGGWLSSWLEAIYKADKMAWTVDDDELANRQSQRPTSFPVTAKDSFYDNSKHTFLQIVEDWAFCRGETRLLDSTRAFSETIQDPLISANVQPYGNFVAGPYGALVESAVAVLEMADDPDLAQWVHTVCDQWDHVVFQQQNSFGVNTATLGWQAPVGTPIGSADPDGYMISWAAGKSSDRQNYGYVTQGWTELRLGAQAYHRYVHYLREASPNDALVGDLLARADDWYHYAHRSIPDDWTGGTGDFFEIDVFAGDAGNPSPDPFSPPGPDIDTPDPSGYAFQGIVDFLLEAKASETALSYGVEMHRSISKNQYDSFVNDPMLNDFVWRYCVHYGLLKP